MAQRQHTIELNGQKYDAVTGKIIAPAGATAPAKTSAHKATPVHSSKPVKNAPKHLDGFTRRPGPAKVTKAHQSSSVTHAVHHKTDKSQTLMRTAVKKPVSTKIHSKITPKHHAPALPTEVATPAVGLFGSMQPGRALRASHITKSSLISKFGATMPNIKTATIPVKPAPKPLKAATQPSPSKVTAPAPVVSAIAHTSQKTDEQHANPFHKAIDNASSHEQPRARKQRYHHKVAHKLHVSPRLVNFVGFAVLALGISGFLAYQNLPELSMRVASTRAGLDASLPAYQPAGFKIAGPIEYEPGAVTLNYKSSSDERSFNVTQKNSSWNSETLLESFVSPTKEPYQTFQTNGRTIYIYEGNKATWVDGGVWYNINGQANLNSDQLLKIAESL